jgi:hypothetical protein
MFTSSLSDRIRKALQRRQLLYGRDYNEIVIARQHGEEIVPDKEMKKWQDDLEALSIWEQRLKEYREALSTMRISSQTG